MTRKTSLTSLSKQKSQPYEQQNNYTTFVNKIKIYAQDTVYTQNFYKRESTV